jgi:hypothetical protein
MKMTKKKVFVISLAITVTNFLLIGGNKTLDFWCGENNYDCRSNLLYFNSYLFLFLPILLFSIITYFIKEEVFRVWLKFTYWYFPVYILVILFLSDNSGGFFSYLLSSKFFAVTLSGLYIIISFFLVLLLFPLKSSKK